MHVNQFVAKRDTAAAVDSNAPPRADRWIDATCRPTVTYGRYLTGASRARLPQQQNAATYSNYTSILRVMCSLLCTNVYT